MCIINRDPIEFNLMQFFHRRVGARLQINLLMVLHQ